MVFIFDKRKDIKKIVQSPTANAKLLEEIEKLQSPTANAKLLEEIEKPAFWCIKV